MERVWNASSFCCNDEQKTGLDRHNLISMTIPRYRVIIFSASVRYRLRLERGFSDWTIGWRFQGPVGGAEGARKEGVLNKRPTRLHNWARDWTLAAGGADGGRRWHRHHTFSGRWCKWDANEMQMNRPAQRCWVCGRRRPFATGVAFVFCFFFVFFVSPWKWLLVVPPGPCWSFPWKRTTLLRRFHGDRLEREPRSFRTALSLFFFSNGRNSGRDKIKKANNSWPVFTEFGLPGFSRRSGDARGASPRAATDSEGR